MSSTEAKMQVEAVENVDAKSTEEAKTSSEVWFDWLLNFS